MKKFIIMMIIAGSCEFWEDYNNMTYVTIGAATNIVIYAVKIDL